MHREGDALQGWWAGGEMALAGAFGSWIMAGWFGKPGSPMSLFCKFPGLLFLL